jgi:hypothetical protein
VTSQFRPVLTELEPRLGPSATDLGRGVLHVRDLPNFDVVAFPGWEGGLSVLGLAAATGEVWVGAGPGGGPRVASFDVETGIRTRDYFAGDPATRSGVVLVDPLATGQGVPATRAAFSYGDPTGYTAFLDFEGPVTRAERERVTQGARAYFDRAGLTRIYWTDARPAAIPGSYATVVVGAPTSWGGPEPFRSAGYSSTSALAELPGPDPWQAKAVYVASGPSAPAVVAHELGHGFGLPHKGGTIMAGDETAPALGFDADQTALISGRIDAWLLARDLAPSGAGAR